MIHVCNKAWNSKKVQNLLNSWPGFQSYLIADLQGPAISVFSFAVQRHLQWDIKIPGLTTNSHSWKPGH